MSFIYFDIFHFGRRIIIFLHTKVWMTMTWWMSIVFKEKMQDWLLLEALELASVPALKTCCWWARIEMPTCWSPLTSCSCCSFDNWKSHHLSSLRQLWNFDEWTIKWRRRQNIPARPILWRDNCSWKSSEPAAIQERETKVLWSCTRS